MPSVDLAGIFIADVESSTPPENEPAPPPPGTVNFPSEDVESSSEFITAGGGLMATEVLEVAKNFAVQFSEGQQLALQLRGVKMWATSASLLLQAGSLAGCLTFLHEPCAGTALVSTKLTYSARRQNRLP